MGGADTVNDGTQRPKLVMTWWKVGLFVFLVALMALPAAIVVKAALS